MHPHRGYTARLGQIATTIYNLRWEDSGVTETPNQIDRLMAEVGAKYGLSDELFYTLGVKWLSKGPRFYGIEKIEDDE